MAALGSEPLGRSRRQWRDLVREWGLPLYRGDQIFEGLHVRRLGFDRIVQLPGAVRERLSRELPWALPEIARRQRSADGSVKYGLQLSDGSLVEAVYMPGESSRAEVNEFEDARAPARGGERPITGTGAPLHPITGSSDQTIARGYARYTVCLSSQTGCAVDCAFCVTGRLGGGRNLSAGEIVGQLYAVLSDADRNAQGLRVVFMGMGEPFLNVEGVLGSLDVLFEILSPRRLTVSTSGIVPGFERFREHEPRPNLAVSLNAADETTRQRLMPITRTYPLSEVIAQMRLWPADAHRPITAEYVLIAGVNDSVRDAARLAHLLRGMAVKVNLIPLNEDPVYLPGWTRSGDDIVDRFAARLRDSGVRVTVRRSRGPDARAACGQLKGRTEDLRKRQRT